MNNTSLLGRLTRDVDLSYSQTGVAVGTFTLAVNRKFKSQNGEYEADFIRCKAFKKTAEIIAEYVKKGQQLAITGHIQTGSYQNNEGNTVYTTDVIVDSFTFVESRKSSNSTNTDVYQRSNTNTSNTNQNETYAPKNNEYAYNQTNDNQSQAQNTDLGQKIDIHSDDLPF